MSLLPIQSKRHQNLVIFCGHHHYIISNVKKVVSNIFGFGANLPVKQPNSLLNICTFKMKSNFFSLQE